MTELALLYWNFWSKAIPFSDGYLPFFIEQLVPTNTPFPYGTYSLSRGDIFTNIMETVRIWTRSTNVKQLMGLLDYVEEAVPSGGTILELPNGKGALTLYRGTPFIQRQPMPDGEQDIQVGYCNVQIQSFIY